MKSLLVISLLAASLSAFGAQYMKKTFSKIFYAETEEQLLADVEAAIPVIEAGQDKGLAFSMKLEKCDKSPRYIKVGKLFTKKIYTRVDGVLVPKVKGTLIVTHGRCFEIYK